MPSAAHLPVKAVGPQADPMGMRPALVLLALVVLASAATAEIYRWTDAQGQIHFTQDLSQVPVGQRPSARTEADAAAPSRVQTYSKGAPAASHRRARKPSGRGLVHIRYEQQQGAMMVMVRLNDRVTAPFVVDTGASDVTIPASVARSAGILVGPDTPTALYQTANGVVSHPIVNLDSVQVGDARVEGVRGSISDSMQIGLLGGTFFNNFTFQIDPGAQVISLRPNDRVRGGVSETQWRGRFAELNGKIETLEAYIADNHFFRESRREELAQRLAALEDSLEELDVAADRAGVPQGWRDG
ncbi:MAG: DUF4124 domain-containing protein [bacterium]|nr:DUF4124 domain-containing protein [bacterium]